MSHTPTWHNVVLMQERHLRRSLSPLERTAVLYEPLVGQLRPHEIVGECVAFHNSDIVVELHLQNGWGKQIRVPRDAPGIRLCSRKY